MSLIKVRCTDQVLKIVEAPVVASGGKNEVKVEFDFCEKWAGHAKTALFYRDIEEPYYSELDSDDTCVVPEEVYYEEGTFYFSVFGDKDETRRTSTTVKYKVKKGYVAKGANPPAPAPDVYQQIMDAVARIEAGQKDYVDALLPQKTEEAVANYLSKHPAETTPVDTTLTKAGQAADAKATGEAIQKSSDAAEREMKALEGAVLDMEGRVDSLEQNTVPGTAPSIPSAQQDIIPAQSVEVTVFGNYPDYGYVWDSENIAFAGQIVPGETYCVLFNGKQYDCAAKEVEFGALGNYIVLGNAYIPRLGEDSGEPFAIVSLDGESATLYTNVEGVSTGYSGTYTHDLRVYQNIERPVLPVITEADEGKVPKVVGGELVYAEITIPDSGGNVDQSQIDQSVADYLAQNPVSGGMSATAKALLISILRNAVYTTNQSASITALEAALAVSGGNGDSGDSGGNGESQTITFTQTGSVLAISGIDNITTITQTGSVLALA